MGVRGFRTLAIATKKYDDPINTIGSTRTIAMHVSRFSKIFFFQKLKFSKKRKTKKREKKNYQKMVFLNEFRKSFVGKNVGSVRDDNG